MVMLLRRKNLKSLKIQSNNPNAFMLSLSVDILQKDAATGTAQTE
ncbi:hypothetical protein NYA22BAC_01799 [Parasphingorhabdus sp. NYA22]